MKIPLMVDNEIMYLLKKIRGGIRKKKIGDAQIKAQDGFIKFYMEIDLKKLSDILNR